MIRQDQIEKSISKGIDDFNYEILLKNERRKQILRIKSSSTSKRHTSNAQNFNGSMKINNAKFPINQGW